MSNNQKLFQVLEQHNTTITDLNTKLNALREDYEKETKKKYNQINERISKVEDESKDLISFRNSNIDNISSTNNIKENEKIKNEINLINKTKISIILPIFNCQKTIIPTIRSIQNQNMKEFEIILVNDFSSDNSLKIIQELAYKDHRIKIIKNNKNMGTLYSRCVGTLNAKGKYTFPLDNDDLFMDYNLFEIIFKEAEKGNFDIVGFKAIRGFNYFIHISELIDDVFHDHKDNLILYQPELGIHSLTKNKKFCPNDIHIWGKSIKTEIYKMAINSLGKNKYSYFIVWAEDTSMVFILYNLAQSYKFISKYGVFHLMSEITSSFTQPNDNKMFGEIFLLEIIFNFSKNNLESKKIVIEKLLEIRNSDFFSLMRK